MDVLLLSVYILTNICIAIGGMTPKTIIISSETSRWIHQSEREQRKTTLDSTPNGFFSSTHVIDQVSSTWYSFSSSSSLSSTTLPTTSPTSTYQILPSKSTTYQRQSSTVDSLPAYQSSKETSINERTTVDSSSVHQRSEGTSRYGLKTSTVDNSPVFQSFEETPIYERNTSITESLPVYQSSEEISEHELKTSIVDSSKVYQSSEETSKYERKRTNVVSSPVYLSSEETSKYERKSTNVNSSPVYLSSEETSNYERKSTNVDSSPVYLSSEEITKYESQTSTVDSFSVFKGTEETSKYERKTSIVDGSPGFRNSEKTSKYELKNFTVNSSPSSQSSKQTTTYELKTSIDETHYRPRTSILDTSPVYQSSEEASQYEPETSFSQSSGETSRYELITSKDDSSSDLQTSISNYEETTRYEQDISNLDRSLYLQSSFSKREVTTMSRQESATVDRSSLVQSLLSTNQSFSTYRHESPQFDKSVASQIPLSTNGKSSAYLRGMSNIDETTAVLSSNIESSMKLSSKHSHDPFSKSMTTNIPSSSSILEFGNDPKSSSIEDISSVLLLMSTYEPSVEMSTYGTSSDNEMETTFTPASSETLSDSNIPKIVSYSGNLNSGTKTSQLTLSGGSVIGNEMNTEYSNPGSSTKGTATASSTIAKSSSISGIEILLASNFSTSEIAHWFESVDDLTKAVSTESNTWDELTSELKSQDIISPSESLSRFESKLSEHLVVDDVTSGHNSIHRISPSDTYSNIESESTEYVIFEDETFQNYDKIPSIDTYRVSSATSQSEAMTVQGPSYKAEDHSHLASSVTSGTSSMDEVNMEYSRLQAFTYPPFPRETASTKASEASPSLLSTLVSHTSTGIVPEETSMSIKTTSLFEYDEITETTYRILSIPELLRLHQISQQSMATESQFLEPTLTSHSDLLTQQTITEDFAANQEDVVATSTIPSGASEFYGSSYLKHDWYNETNESKLSDSYLRPSATDFSGVLTEIQSSRDKISESLFPSKVISSLFTDISESVNSNYRETSSVDSPSTLTALPSIALGPMALASAESASPSSHYETSLQSLSKPVLQPPSISINVRTKSSRHKIVSLDISSSASQESSYSKMDVVQSSQSSNPISRVSPNTATDNISTINLFSSSDETGTSLPTMGTTDSSKRFSRKSMSPAETSSELVSTTRLTEGDAPYTYSHIWETEISGNAVSLQDDLSHAKYYQNSMSISNNLLSSTGQNTYVSSKIMTTSSSILAILKTETFQEDFGSIWKTSDSNNFQTFSQPLPTDTNFEKDSAPSVSVTDSEFIDTRSPLPSLDLDSNELSISDDDLSDSDVNMGSVQSVADASDLMKIYSSLSSPSLYTVSLSALREQSEMTRPSVNSWQPEIHVKDSMFHDSVGATSILSEPSMLEETPILSTSSFSLVTSSDSFTKLMSMDSFGYFDVMSSSLNRPITVTESSQLISVVQSSLDTNLHNQPLSDRSASSLPEASSSNVIQSTESPVNLFPTKTIASQGSTELLNWESLLKSMELLPIEESSSRSFEGIEIQGTGYYSTQKGPTFDLSTTDSTPQTITEDIEPESHVSSLSNTLSVESSTHAISSDTYNGSSSISLANSTVTNFSFASIEDRFPIASTVTPTSPIASTYNTTATATDYTPGKDSTPSDYILKWVFTTSDDITTEDFIAKIIKGLETTYEIGYSRQHSRRKRSIDGIDVTVQKTKPLDNGKVELQFSVSRDGNLVQASEAAVTFSQVSAEELEENTGVQTFGDLGIAPLQTVLSSKPEFTENIDHVIQTGDTVKSLPATLSRVGDQNQGSITASVSSSTIIQESTAENSVKKSSPTHDDATETFIMTTSEVKEVYLTATQSSSSLSTIEISENVSSKSESVHARSSPNAYERTRLFTTLPMTSSYHKLTQTTDIPSDYVTLSSSASVDQQTPMSENATPEIVFSFISSVSSVTVMSTQSDAYHSEVPLESERLVTTLLPLSPRFTLSSLANDLRTELQTTLDAVASKVVISSQIISSSEVPSTDYEETQRTSNFVTESVVMLSPSTSSTESIDILASQLDTRSSETQLYPELTYEASFLTSSAFDSSLFGSSSLFDPISLFDPSSPLEFRFTTSPLTSDLRTQLMTSSLSDTVVKTIDDSSQIPSSLENLFELSSTESPSMFLRTRISRLPLTTISPSMVPQIPTMISNDSKQLEITSPSDLIDDYSSFSLREGFSDVLSSGYQSDMSSSNLPASDIRFSKPFSSALDPSSVDIIMNLLSSAMSANPGSTISDIQARYSQVASSDLSNTALPDEASVSVLPIPVISLTSTMDSKSEAVLLQSTELNSIMVNDDMTSYPTDWLRTRISTLESTIEISGSGISQEQTPSITETVLSELLTRLPYRTEVSGTVSDVRGLMSQGSSKFSASEVDYRGGGTASYVSSVFGREPSSADVPTRNTEYSLQSLSNASLYFDNSEIISSPPKPSSVSSHSEESATSSLSFIGNKQSSTTLDSVLLTSVPSYPNMISISSREYGTAIHSRLSSQDTIFISDSYKMESSTTTTQPLLKISAVVSSVPSLGFSNTSLMTSMQNGLLATSIPSTLTSVSDTVLPSVTKTDLRSFPIIPTALTTQTTSGPTFTDSVLESLSDTIISSPSILLPSQQFETYTAGETLSSSSAGNASPNSVTSYTSSTRDTSIQTYTETMSASADSSESLPSLLSSFPNSLGTQYNGISLSTETLSSLATADRSTDATSLIIPITLSASSTVSQPESSILTSPHIASVYPSNNVTFSSSKSANFSPSKSYADSTPVSDAVNPTQAVTMSSSEIDTWSVAQSTTGPATTASNTTEASAVPTTQAPTGPPESALMLVTMNIELGVNISSPAFIEQLESDLTQLFLIALSERTKRDTRRYRRQADVNAEVVKSERDTETADQVTTTFAVQQEGGYVEADLAVPVFNRISQEQTSIILSQQVLGPIRAAVETTPTTRPNTNLLILVAVLIPAVLLLVGVLFIIAQMRRRKMRANAVGDLPPRYQRGETLEDHNLTVDVEKGEIVDKTPTSTPSLHPRASHTDRKVPLMGGVCAPGLGDSEEEGDKTRYPEDVTLVEGEKGSHRSLILKEKELLEKLGVHDIHKTPSETSDDLTLEIPKRSKSKKLKSGGASEYSTVGSECPLIPSSASMTTVSSIDSDVHTDASDEFTVIISNNQSPEMKGKRPKMSPDKGNSTNVQKAKAVPPSPDVQTAVSDVKSSSTASPVSDSTSPTSDQVISSDLQTSPSIQASSKSTLGSTPSTQASTPNTQASSPLSQSSTGVQTSQLITPHLPLTSTGVQASDLNKPLTSVGVQASSTAPSTETRSVDTQTSKGSSVTSGSDLSSPDEKIVSLPAVSGIGVQPDTECKMVQTPWRQKRRTDPRDIYIDDDDLQDPNSPVNTRLSISAGPGETSNFLFPLPDSITKAYNRAINRGRKGSSSRSSDRLTDPDSPSISSIDSDSDRSVSSGRLSLEEDTLEDMIGPLQMAQQSEVTASWSRKNSGQSYKYSIGDEDETPRYMQMFPTQSIVPAHSPDPVSLVQARHPAPQPRPRSSLTRRGAMVAQIEEDAIAEEEEAVRRTEDTTKRAQELLQQTHALATPDLQSLSPSDMMERIREELKRSEIPVPGSRGVGLPRGERKSPSNKTDTSGSICSRSSGDSGGASTDSTAALLERVRGELQRIDSKDSVKPPKPPRARSRKKGKNPKS